MSNITQNFTLKEVLEWIRNFNLSSQITQKCIEMCTNSYNNNNVIKKNIKSIAEKLEEIRSWANTEAVKLHGNQINGKNVAVGIKINCWLRPVEWEIFRGRSGRGEHPNGWAVDFVFVSRTLSQAQLNNLMEIWFKSNQNWNGGLAIKKNKNTISFIHIDLGARRRWTY